MPIIHSPDKPKILLVIIPEYFFISEGISIEDNNCVNSNKGYKDGIIMFMQTVTAKETLCVISFRFIKTIGNKDSIAIKRKYFVSLFFLILKYMRKSSN